MTSKARFAARYARAAPAVLMPPNLQEMGSMAFTARSFAELDAWLAEEGWPAEHMDAAMLEGYLVALLVWPIELAAGAWLPAIWGIRGWKVAAKIATSESYHRFLALVIGYLQDLERRMTAAPPLRPVRARPLRPDPLCPLLRGLCVGDRIHGRATRQFRRFEFSLGECSFGRRGDRAFCIASINKVDRDGVGFRGTERMGRQAHGGEAIAR